MKDYTINAMKIPKKNSTICIDRGYHEYEELIDPKSGGFIRCKDCGHEVDCEDPDKDG